MRWVLLFAFLAGCASHERLVPGRATAAEVDAVMGRATEQRAGPGGETVRYYSRQPNGRQIYAARFAADGRLVAIEQRLTTDNMEKMVRGSWSSAQVRDLLGPPYEMHTLPRLEREVWTYWMDGTTWPKHLYVQFSRDGILREVLYIDDPNLRSMDIR